MGGDVLDRGRVDRQGVSQLVASFTRCVRRCPRVAGLSGTPEATTALVRDLAYTRKRAAGGGRALPLFRGRRFCWRP